MGQTANRITFDSSTTGATEETINISLNGAASGASVSIADGSALEIGDITLASLSSGTTIFKVEFTTDGSTWGDVANYSLVSNVSSQSQDFTTGPRITGGANVAVRLRATTASGIARVLGHISATNTAGA